jgi:hypothetical protein
MDETGQFPEIKRRCSLKFETPDDFGQLAAHRISVSGVQGKNRPVTCVYTRNKWISDL